MYEYISYLSFTFFDIPMLFEINYVNTPQEEGVQRGHAYVILFHF